MISAIVAVDKNWGIGYNNDLLAHIPEDMKNFVHLTTGNVVIMGRKTWDSLPKKPLPNRMNIVITSQDIPNEENVKFLTMNQAKAYAVICRPQNVFIIGGESIYKEFLPLCNKIYLTQIEKEYENVDTYFPNLDKMDEWEISSCTDLREYKDIQYAFLTYDRI